MIMNAVLLEAAYFAGVKKFLFMSSCTGYPELERPLKEEDMFYADPADVYFSVGWMSRYSEVLCRMYATKLKNPLSIIILRPTTIYGEYEDFHFETCHMLPALVRKVIERQDPIEIWGTGENARDLVYADDVFDACLLALEKTDNFDVFNIASGRQYSVNELLKIILGLEHYTDARVIYNTSKPSTINRQIVDFSKAQEVLGFKPKTSLRQGVTRMIEWYKKIPF
jgi:GDP-L-fucose synthase